ncbi:hypothetical protein U1Q18_007987 [Sarracenia purpurea var. burkii]
MPPKTSSAAGSRRSTPRATARKLTPRVAATKSTADASPEITPPSAATTATTTFPEPIPSLTTTKVGATPKSSPQTTSKFEANEIPATATTETTPLTSPDTSKNARKFTTKAIVSNASSEELSEVTVTAVRETTSDPTTETASMAKSESALSETFSEKINEANVKNSEESKEPNAQNETLAEKACETAAVEAALPGNASEDGQESGSRPVRDGGTKTGLRTVVKKTVRVVKKVVKKKVPKMGQKGRAASSSEELGKVEMVDNEHENADATAEASVLDAMEVDNHNSLDSDSLEVANLKCESISSVSMEVDNPSSHVVSMEAENPCSNPCASNPLVVENRASNILGSVQVENPEEPEAAAGKENNSMHEISSEGPVSDIGKAKNTKNEGELAVSTTETHLGDQNVELAENQNDEFEPENVGSRGGGGSGVNEGVEKFDVGDLKGEIGIGDGVVLSGEMEALQRRKRRKTEIFVGGLDKDAKEEDIRKVFQEVGDIMDVRLVMNDKTGKNKGFAFVRYVSAADANKALEKFASVEICGKQCGAVPVEGNDTIFLGNIDKKWKSEDIVKLLQEIGIEKIDKVTVKANPSKMEYNRGFAFLELETSRDAQNAYRKLQKKDVFGKHQKIKVAWAEPLSEPDEEEMLKVKSVYAEYLPSSWDEEKVKDYFNKFGEIENVVLAKNLRSSRRKDFAFVNYTSREAALACIEAFNRESLNEESSKVNVKVSLAKPIPKGKQVKHVSIPRKDPLKEKMKAPNPVIKLHQAITKRKNVSSSYDKVAVDKRSSTTDELVQLLREQASWRQPQTGLARGSVDVDYPYSSPARKRPASLLGDDPLYSDVRGYPRTRFESTFSATSPSGLSQGVGTASLPYNPRQAADYASGPLYGVEDYPNSLQISGAPYHGSSVYRR